MARKKKSTPPPCSIEEALGDKNLKKLESILEEALPAAQEAFTCRASDAISESFIYLYENRDNESREIRLIHENALQLYNCGIRALDGAGFGKAAEKIIPLFDGVKLSRHIGELEREQEMYSRAGLRAKDLLEITAEIDDTIPDLVSDIRQKKFDFGCLILPDNVGYLGPHVGNSWRLARGLLGGATLIADAVCSVPTAGLAGASIVAGIAGVGSAVAGVP